MPTIDAVSRGNERQVYPPQNSLPNDLSPEWLMLRRSESSPLLPDEFSSDRRNAALASVARELHDGVIQELCYLRFQGQVLAERLDARRQAESHSAEMLVAQAERALEAVRDVINNHDHRQPSLGDLVHSIRCFAERVQAESGIKFELIDQVSQNLSEACKFECFRIVQEALRNCVKHSEASRVRIRLRTKDGWLGVRVVDNGEGLTSRRQAIHHRGLRNMRHRARSLGGAFSIWSRPYLGTIVQAVLPTAE